MKRILNSGVLNWAWRCSEGHRRSILASCLCGIMNVFAGLAFVWISKLLVDAAINPDTDRGAIIILSVSMVALMLVELFFSFSTTYLANKTEIKIKNDLRETLYDHLLGTRWDRMAKIHSGDLINRLTEDVRVVAGTVCGTVPSMVLMLIQFAAAFAMLCTMNWKLAVCIVIIIPFFFLLSRVYIKRTRKMTAEIRKSDSMIQSTIQEGLQHRAVVQTLECEQEMEDRLSNYQTLLYSQTMNRTKFGIFNRSMVRMCYIACYATAFIWSIWNLRTGVMTYGMMIAFLQLVARIQNPMVGAAQLVPGIVHSLSSIDRLMEMEGITSEEKGAPMKISSPAGIRITNLSFIYEDGTTKIFDNFSYDFRPGSKTVVMGETGIGKSTLVKLLLALLHPNQGSIVIYGDKEVEVCAETRCNMIYVPQGNSLLEGTIRSNLLLGNTAATDDMMLDALHIAAADFVSELPDGLDTYCGESGIGLSEGQAQRIAIARALLRNGSILLLDEFNSSLDENTATTLMERLIQSRRSSTIIFISHRPEVGNFCDNILRL
ncbi:MAG: ABC transporter ATP-binding protein [Bacteroidales bacterium]|nr:ABC transporter ATP-binding protein [Bacteroidales bacterium]